MTRWLLTIECARRLRVLQRAHLAWLQDRTNLVKKHDYDVAWSDWQRIRESLDTQPGSLGERERSDAIA